MGQAGCGWGRRCRLFPALLPPESLPRVQTFVENATSAVRFDSTPSGCALESEHFFRGFPQAPGNI